MLLSAQKGSMRPLHRRLQLQQMKELTGAAAMPGIMLLYQLTAATAAAAMNRPESASLDVIAPCSHRCRLTPRTPDNIDPGFYPHWTQHLSFITDDCCCCCWWLRKSVYKAGGLPAYAGSSTGDDSPEHDLLDCFCMLRYSSRHISCTAAAAETA